MSSSRSRSFLPWFIRPAVLAVAGFLTLLVTISVLAVEQWHQRRTADAAVEHSRQIIETLERIQTYLVDLESQRRGYLLTRDPAYLGPYGTSDDSLRREIEALQLLVADDSVQSLRAEHLSRVADKSLRPMAELLEEARSAGGDAAQLLLQSIGEIRSQLEQMLDAAHFTRERWLSRVEDLQEDTIWLVSAAIVIAVIFAGAAFAIARYEARRRFETAKENIRLSGDLEKREAKIRHLVDSNILGITITNVRGEIFEANDAFLEIVGYTRDDLVSGRIHWVEMTPPEWREVSQRAKDQILATGRCEPFEKEYVRKDGSRVPVLIRAANFAAGREETVAFVIDLRERKRAEYLVGQVFESSPDSVCIVGRDYRYQRVNPIYALNFGIPADQIIGKHVIDLLGQEVFEQKIKPHLDICFAGGEVSDENWFTNALGRRYMAVTYSPMRPDTHVVEAALVISRDLTEHVIASETLRETQTALAHVNRVTTMGLLTASIAHEVNQPIASTVTNAQAAMRWLAAQPPVLGEVQRSLERIAKDGMRAGDVIRQIRGLIKNVPPQKDRLDINQTVLEAVALMRGEMQRTGVSLQTQLVDNPPLIEGDRIQLQQVLLNLMLNAIQAMGDMGDDVRELEIRTTTDASANVLVAVRDSGPGLSPDSLDRLFDAFYTTKAGGMGMGLSICRSIIEAHSGKVWATADVRRGAIFQFLLPSREAREP